MQPRRKFWAVRSCFMFCGPTPAPCAAEALGTGEAMPSGNWTLAGILDMEGVELSESSGPCAPPLAAGIKGACKSKAQALMLCLAQQAFSASTTNLI